jgi:hypothetical protein
MHIVRTTVIAVAVLALGTWSSARLTAGGQKPANPANAHQMPMPGKAMMPSAMTRDQKIANATSAAPASISAKATVLDYPAKEGDKPSVLRAGTNGWTCLPDIPDTDGSDPMCLDQTWMKWFEAYSSKTPPEITGIGIGYMTAPGGARYSNSDPYAKTATPGNQWSHHAPHMMIVVPDMKSLDGISTDPNNGGPYVMFKGTPYAHIMVPTTAPMHMMK